VQQAEQTNTQISKLLEAADSIKPVVKVIRDIAAQTNLLALNATIEAARAGEAGKGFAVVAQEVKALAAQSAEATGIIIDQVAGIQGATQESASAIREIGATIGRLSEIASTIAGAVQVQRQSTHEITKNVRQAADNTLRVADNIVDVNRGAIEIGTASAQVLGSARSVANDSARLKLEMDKFLVTVRAA